MKLPFTEKFLWDLYNFIQKSGNIPTHSFPVKTIKGAFYSDLYELSIKHGKKKSRHEFSKLISYLKKKGLIKIEKLKKGKALVITSKGEERILKIKNKFLLFSSNKKKRKDGKWIMITFDIPERKKVIRNYLREKLMEFGFQKFQHSIWMSPYDILKEIKEVIQNLKIEKHVKIFLIQETET